ncbi:MAG: 4-hydroxy-3-methylbut-2-enyl diphosphate reductase [Bacteroidetes bacterium]|nr:4-hydroxy-3-methylbut-2-enyl diphosphate reductase [Bacteroidota bacterium]
MKTFIDPHSGFCFGVVSAIQIAEEVLEQNGRLYCLGDIVHNNMEVQRLREKGLITINHDEFSRLRNNKALIRAHGEPPSTYALAAQNNITLIDASCHIVLKLQHKIRLGYEEMLLCHGQVVIYGQEGHAEVLGLLGQTNGEAVIISGAKDLDRIDFYSPVRLYAQTTKSIEGFNDIADRIRVRMEAANPGREIDFIAFDTICRQVSNRSKQLIDFARKYDVIVFVSGKMSSNGMVLYEICKEVNRRTLLVSEPDEIEPSLFAGAQTVGICGATSTPMWLMEQIAGIIEKMGE